MMHVVDSETTVTCQAVRILKRYLGQRHWPLFLKNVLQETIIQFPNLKNWKVINTNKLVYLERYKQGKWGSRLSMERVSYRIF